MKSLAGCLPILDGDKFVLVTSRHHPGELVFPKGKVEAGEDAGSAAKRETEEEAGIAGQIIGDIGWIDGCQWFVLRVDNMADRWLEMHQRDRVVVYMDEAVSRPDLRPNTRNIIVRLMERFSPACSSTVFG